MTPTVAVAVAVTICQGEPPLRVRVAVDDDLPGRLPLGFFEDGFEALGLGVCGRRLVGGRGEGDFEGVVVEAEEERVGVVERPGVGRVVVGDDGGGGEEEDVGGADVSDT
jgi:hypothetical protein